MAESDAVKGRVPLLVVDNYDSFTYNLVQYLGEQGADCLVHRNDAPELASLSPRDVAGVVISPGPGRPDGAGHSLQVAARFAGQVPMLGICLGYQVIAQHYGVAIERANAVVHGKASAVEHDGTGVFAGLPSPLQAGRYHSLTLAGGELPAGLRGTAWLAEADGEVLDDGTAVELMAIAHEGDNAHGVLFHPESVLTLEGKAMLGNFCDICGGKSDGLQSGAA